MLFKLFDEEGDYIDKDVGTPKNLLQAETVYTPEGVNVGWKEFNNIDEAMQFFNVELAKK